MVLVFQISWIQVSKYRIFEFRAYLFRQNIFISKAGSALSSDAEIISTPVILFNFGKVLENFLIDVNF